MTRGDAPSSGGAWEWASAGQTPVASQPSTSESPNVEGATPSRRGIGQAPVSTHKRIIPRVDPAYLGRGAIRQPIGPPRGAERQVAGSPVVGIRPPAGNRSACHPGDRAAFPKTT